MTTADGQECRLQIWDTSGENSFHDILPIYLKQANGLIMTYDITDRGSFQAVDTFLDLMKGNVDTDIPRVLVGTKMDKASERVITFEQAQKKANKHFHRLYMETSAMENSNVDEAFNMLISDVVS